MEAKRLRKYRRRILQSPGFARLQWHDLLHVRGTYERYVWKLELSIELRQS